VLPLKVARNHKKLQKLFKYYDVLFPLDSGIATPYLLEIMEIDKYYKVHSVWESGEYDTPSVLYDYLIEEYLKYTPSKHAIAYPVIINGANYLKKFTTGV
jgi:hypothetical protein